MGCRSQPSRPSLVTKPTNNACNTCICSLLHTKQHRGRQDLKRIASELFYQGKKRTHFMYHPQKIKNQSPSFTFLGSTIHRPIINDVLSKNVFLRPMFDKMFK